MDLFPMGSLDPGNLNADKFKDGASLFFIDLKTTLP
jgi:hypothetical protein